MSEIPVKGADNTQYVVKTGPANYRTFGVDSVTLSNAWQKVFTGRAAVRRIVLGDPGQRGDICWSTDPALDGETTVSGIPLHGSFDFGAVPPTNDIYARSPSGAVLSIENA